jgi:hypothetical protein
MGHLLSCKDCLVAVERYKIWDISCHARTALWLWRGTRYGHLLSCKDCLVAVERYKIWDISYHAGTAPRNAPSRIYGLQIRKDLT